MKLKQYKSIFQESNLKLNRYTNSQLNLANKGNKPLTIKISDLKYIPHEKKFIGSAKLLSKYASSYKIELVGKQGSPIIQ